MLMVKHSAESRFSIIVMVAWNGTEMVSSCFSQPTGLGPVNLGYLLTNHSGKLDCPSQCHRFSREGRGGS